MEYVISILVLALSLAMFVLPVTKKLELILFSCICLESFSFSFVSFGACNKMLCLFFFLSELKNYHKYISEIKKTGIYKLLVIVTIGTLFLIIYSTHAHNPTTLLGLLINDLITKYFVIAYVFVGFRRMESINRFYNVITYAVIILTFFGILNLATKISIIGDITGKNGTDFANMDRSRIVSMFTYAFDYGFCCCIISILAIYGKKRHFIPPSRFNIIMCCSLIGVFICGCRSVIVVEAIMLMVYIVMMYKPYKSFAIILSLCILLGASYIAVPSIREKADTVATAFDAENEEMGESSLFMRFLQFATVFSQIQGHELLGRGYRYFIEDLGYDRNGNGFRDLPQDAQALMGLEGVAMNLLLERGYIGLGIYIVFYGGIIILAYKQRKNTKPEAACAISVLIGFISFGNMTGELSSATITLFATGLFLKLSKFHCIYIQHISKRTQKVSFSKSSCNLACNN